MGKKVKATKKPKEEVTEEKSPALRQEGGLPTVSEMEEAGAFGAENIDNEDILLPKILLMQATSQMVHDGIATAGELRDSLNKDRKLGNAKNPVEFITFGSYKSWMELKNGEYHQMIAYTPATADLKREEQIGDDLFERKLVRNYYCVLVEDVKKGEAFPYVISAKGMSGYAGRTLATHMKMLQATNKPTASKVFKLSCHSDKNEKGSFHVMDIEKGRDTTEVELLTAFHWYKALGTANVKVHETEEKPVAAASPSGAAEQSAQAY